MKNKIEIAFGNPQNQRIIYTGFYEAQFAILSTVICPYLSRDYTVTVSKGV